MALPVFREIGRRAGQLAGQRAVHISAALQSQSNVPALLKEDKPLSLFEMLGFSYPKRHSESLESDSLPVERAELIQLPKEKPKSQMTTLDNGIRVISEKTAGAASTLTYFIDGGSIYETPANHGVSHLMEQMSFKASQHRTHFRFVREAEALGANTYGSASREVMTYSADFAQPYLPQAVEMLSDNVFCPRLQFWEVRDTFEKMKKEVPEQLKKNESLQLNEALHFAAYEGGLGNPIVCPEYAQLDFEHCRLFFQECYTAPRTVISLAGRHDHEELVELVSSLLGDLPKTPKHEHPVSKYVGGESRVSNGSPLTSMTLAFEYKGGWLDVKNSVIASVVQALLGGGGSFSAGGPGKGMHTRLYRNILTRHNYVQQCVAYASLYHDTGLIGVHAAFDSTQADKAMGAICDELLALTKPLPAEEIERAKAQTMATVLMNLESKNILADDMGRQVMTFGQRKPLEEYFSIMKGVTSNDINKFASTLLKTKPTLACMGGVDTMPRIGTIAARF